MREKAQIHKSCIKLLELPGFENLTALDQKGIL